MPDSPYEFLTVAEVAGLLRLNPQSVRNWIDAGKLPAYRVGRRVRISRSDFDALIAANYTGHEPGRNEAEETPSYSGEQFWSGEPHPAAVVPDSPSI